MALIEPRKYLTLIEEIVHERGPAPPVPLKMGAVAVVLKNPYAGAYIQDIVPMMDALKPLGQSIFVVRCFWNWPPSPSALGNS